MFKLMIAFSKIFALFILGIFLAFHISLISGRLEILFAYLPLIWEFLWRFGLLLMFFTSVALFIEGLNSGTKKNF
jgi:hypothetical protein